MHPRLCFAVCTLAVVFLAELTEGQFMCPCGMGCLSRRCYCSMGCTNCRPDWCTIFAPNGLAVCVPDTECGRGKECITTFGMRVCTRARRGRG